MFILFRTPTAPSPVVSPSRLDPLLLGAKKLAAQHAALFRRANGKTRATAACLQHHDFDVGPNEKRLTVSPRQYEAPRALSRRTSIFNPSSMLPPAKKRGWWIPASPE